MRQVLTLYRSSVGKKVLMAASGILLVGFIVMHMLGNLKMFQGPEAMDGYAAFLRSVGYPIFPEYGLLWILRVGLLAAFGVHVVAAFQLWRKSAAARAEGYRKEDSQVFSYASRTMRWGGVILLLFAVYHILHITTGHAHPEFEYGSVYRNVVLGFQSVPVVLFYVAAVGALAFHIHHGLWSVFATLGNGNPKIERIRRPLAASLALLLFVGFASVPVGVVAGILTLP